MSYERLAVHHLSDALGNLVVVLQYPGLDIGPAVLVAPLLQDATLLHIPYVTVEIEFDGKTFLLATHQITAIPHMFIGPMAGNVLSYEYEISRALSRLFFGN